MEGRPDGPDGPDGPEGPEVLEDPPGPDDPSGPVASTGVEGPGCPGDPDGPTELNPSDGPSEEDPRPASDRVPAGAKLDGVLPLCSGADLPDASVVASGDPLAPRDPDGPNGPGAPGPKRPDGPAARGGGVALDSPLSTPVAAESRTRGDSGGGHSSPGGASRCVVSASGASPGPQGRCGFDGWEYRRVTFLGTAAAKSRGSTSRGGSHIRATITTRGIANVYLKSIALLNSGVSATLRWRPTNIKQVGCLQERQRGVPCDDPPARLAPDELGATAADASSATLRVQFYSFCLNNVY